MVTVCMPPAYVGTRWEQHGHAQPTDLLAFEAAHPGWSSNKEMRIRHELGITPVRYAVLLERAAES
ncbi:DUF3263 domain-containing protein [Microbacterium sp. NPDC056052]|uniref:DUF3263 domain-containing protein n=1 Tax=Microbacterium sp. NPDC056052 TaxID=3345695 RepID=UPI0035DDAFF9